MVVKTLSFNDSLSEGVSLPMYGTDGREVPAAALLLTGEHGGAQGVSGHKGRRQRGQPGEGAKLFAMFVCVELNASMIQKYT